MSWGLSGLPEEGTILGQPPKEQSKGPLEAKAHQSWGECNLR